MEKNKNKTPNKYKYSEKLKDPRWQKKRLEVFKRDEFTCQKCYDDESTLHVHHRYYIKGKDPWDYPLDAFVTLCEECHQNEREHRSAAEDALFAALKQKFLTEEIDTLATGFRDMPMLDQPEIVASVYEWALTTPEVQRDLIKRYFDNLLKNKQDHEIKGKGS